LHSKTIIELQEDMLAVEEAQEAEVEVLVAEV